MGQILVRNLDDMVVERLKATARSRGQSLEQTVRDVLTEAVQASRDEFWALADRIREETRGAPLDPVAVIREDRDKDHGREW
jgi:plasmid stability protein